MVAALPEQLCHATPFFVMPVPLEHRLSECSPSMPL
jgi:hypothetical protein